MILYISIYIYIYVYIHTYTTHKYIKIKRGRERKHGKKNIVSLCSMYLQFLAPDGHSRKQK